MNKNIDKKKPAVNLRGKLFYGAGNFGLSFVTQSLVGFIMFFGTAVKHIPGTLMGLAFGIGIVWDAITDPVAGYISDRTHSRRFGRRHGYILLGTVLLTVANIFLWGLPTEISVLAKFVWMLVGILVFQTCCTIINVPYNALALDLTDDYNEQTELQGIKSIFFILGIILPIVLMAVLQSDSRNDMDGRLVSSTYMTLALIGSAVILLFGLITFAGTYSHIPRLNKNARLDKRNNKKFSLKTVMKNFFGILKDRNYRAVILGACATNIASAFLTGIGLHVFTYTFEFTSGQMYLLFGELFAVIIISQPVWLYICKKTDKKPSLMGGLKLAAAALVPFILIFIFKDSFVNKDVLLGILTIPVIVVGVGIGSTYLIPQSMLADVITYNSKADEVNNNATVMGVMTFCYKMAQALSLLIIGFMVEFVGFDSLKETQTPFARNGLGIILLAGLAVGVSAAIFFTSRYKLKKADIPKKIENQELIKDEQAPNIIVKEKNA